MNSSFTISSNIVLDINPHEEYSNDTVQRNEILGDELSEKHNPVESLEQISTKNTSISTTNLVNNRKSSNKFSKRGSNITPNINSSLNNDISKTSPDSKFMVEGLRLSDQKQNTLISFSESLQSSSPIPPPYCSVVKKVKKDNITPANIGEIVLCQIPGISSVSAVAIMKKFGTIRNLIDVVSKDSNCMNDLYTTSSTGNRKLGSNIITNIRKYLIGDTTTLPNL